MDSHFSSLNDQITESLKLRKRDKADHQMEFVKHLNLLKDLDSKLIKNTNNVTEIEEMIKTIV